MSRRTRSRKSAPDELFDTFLETPWWFALVVAVGLGALAGAAWYVTFHIVQGSAATAQATSALADNARLLGLMVAGFVLFVGLVAQCAKLYRRGLPQRFRTIESIRTMPWRTFEHLCAEACRRRGYSVHERGGATPDGGVDIEARRDGEVVLIQCKRYREAGKVGVESVRSLLGVVTHEEATRGLLLCSGSFTSAARELGRDPRLELIGGDGLADWLGGKDVIARATAFASEPVARLGMLPPACPRCGEEMVRRYTRKSPHQGSVFWGCRRFPKCRGTRSA